MVSSRFLHRLTTKLSISVTLLIIFFNEFLLYNLNHSFWTQIECKTENCTRILFVADPQLLGDEYDKSIWSGLATFDSDRYIRKTFSHSLPFSKPNFLLFLGDLLDEGSIATQKQYKRYVKRFNSIFHADNNVKSVHIPGDNDIGGEDGEYISNSNIRRFEIEFMNDDTLEDNENNMQFFRINRMLMEYPKPDKARVEDKLRICLSHMPLLTTGGSFLRGILKDIDPHVIFSAHWHESRILVYPSISPKDLYDNRVETYDLEKLKDEQKYLEIMVPTSSYRMGKIKVGYGMAVLDGTTLHYTVLWTISRFIPLAIYLIWLMILFISFLILRILRKCPLSKCCKRYQQHQKYDLLSNYS